jgi:hypothetical protein
MGGQQVDENMLQSYVFMRFIKCMLYMFHLDVSNTDMSRSAVVYVAMVIHVCYKCMVQMFQLFKRMLQVFYLDVTRM